MIVKPIMSYRNERGTIMDFLELAKRRFSERRFDERTVEPEKLERILEAGRVAPTAHNYQPQHFYLIRSQEAREKLKSVTQFHYNVPLMILVCYDENTAWKSPEETVLTNYNSGEQDATIAATSMMFAAEELDVHTIWVRGFDSGAVRKTFGLPDHMIPVMMLGLGYPTERSKPSALHEQRKPLAEFCTEL